MAVVSKVNSKYLVLVLFVTVNKSSKQSNEISLERIGWVGLEILILDLVHFVNRCELILCTLTSFVNTTEKDCEEENIRIST